MRVVVTAEGAGVDARPSATFGRCPFLVLFDTDSDRCEAIPNPGVRAAHGAGVEAAQRLVDAGAEVLVTGRIGPNAWKVCEAAGVRAFAVAGGTVREVLAAFARGALVPLGVSPPAKAS